MYSPSRFLASLFVGAALLSPLVITGCAEHHYNRVNDVYYHDNHRWTPDEDAAYRRWEAETHREHREYRERKADEQRDYWSWRHSHSDHDHDRDRDHDRH